MQRVNLEQLDLNLLLALHWLLEERGVSRAARRLGLSQSATSHALARLRQLLGDPLLTPVGRTMALSPRAEEVRPHLSDAVDRLRRAVGPSQPVEPATLAGRFRIACTDFVGLVVLEAWRVAVRAAAPGLDLDLVTIETDTVAALTQGSVDLAILPEYVAAMLERTTDVARLVRRPLFEERFASVVREGHRWAGRRPRVKTFAALEHVLVSPRGSGPGVVDDLLAAEGLVRRIAFRVPSFVMALPIVATSDCVATVPSSLVRLAQVKVTELRCPILVPGFTLASAWHPTRTSDPRHRWVRRRLRDAIAASMGPTSG